MKGFFHKLARNAARCFTGRNLLWHVLAIALTYLIVTSGFDWRYFVSTRFSPVHEVFFPAVVLGMMLPIFAPLLLLAAGAICRSLKVKTTAYALGQSALLALAISSFYKVFTGRIPPPHTFAHGGLTDASHGFRLGFLRGGVFWGWPSSHTTVAFAMALALWKLYPENRPLRYLALFYALYIGVGVSVTIHWFSEFAAGAIIGSVIGAVVGESFSHC